MKTSIMKRSTMKRSLLRGASALVGGALIFLVAISAASAQEATNVAKDAKADGKKANETPTDQKKPDPSAHVTAEFVLKDLDFTLNQYVGAVLDVDGSLGAQVTPADDALRAQLGLSKDQGLVVTSVQDGGPADKAGLQKHDVLLTLNGKLVANTDALRQQLQDAGEKAIPLGLLRAGKKLTIEVTPKPSATFLSTVLLTDLGSVWIGVSVAAADETLRANCGCRRSAGWS